MDNLSRRLAVIVHADVAGSTHLVQLDETTAHARIQDTFRRLSETVDRYGGVTNEMRGDALLATFQRTSDAVSAALSFQLANRSYCSALEDAIRPELRIGISLGEIVVAEDTLTGPDVVLAQRLEQLAPTGGVCVSEAVRQSAPARLPFDYDDLGEQAIKGFDEPVHAYEVRPRAGTVIPTPERPVRGDVSRTSRLRGNRRRALAMLVGVTVASLALIGALRVLGPSEPGIESRALAGDDDERRSVAVLPFANLSDDPGQSYFADGITEDLITDLSNVSGLLVIARDSTFVYREMPLDRERIARELRVRYLLEGSIRKANEQVRINVKLIDASTGTHVWAERYDGTLSDVFALQDDVTGQVIAALAARLGGVDQSAGTPARSSEPIAYDAFLQGWEFYRRKRPADLVAARENFSRAIDLDPSFSRAHAALASTYWELYERGWHGRLGLDRDRVQALAEEALARAKAGADASLTHQVASEIHRAHGRYAEAMREAETAVELAPGDPRALVTLAGAVVMAGEPARATELVERAMAIEPHYTPDFLLVLGVARFGEERFDEASDLLTRAAMRNDGDHVVLVPLASALGHLGRREEAEAAIERYMELRAWSFFPTADQLAAGWPYVHKRDRDRLIDGLLAAGLQAR